VRFTRSNHLLDRWDFVSFSPSFSRYSVFRDRLPIPTAQTKPTQESNPVRPATPVEPGLLPAGEEPRSK